MIGSREQHEHQHQPNRFAVLPTAVRLGANVSLTGKGITIAFLDSGFYPHPDLTEPVNRILAYHDITDPGAKLVADGDAQSWQWHGTQTSVAAAGNGFLSDGVYRGLASAAQVVLVKVSDKGRITDDHIVRGLRWVIANKDRYNIRIVSMSLGGDEDTSFNDSLVDQAAEEAAQAGLILVVAAGNSGCTANPRPLPPANSPVVITVGGYNDRNELNNGVPDLYCSNYGVTIDGFIKPEIIAPAMWVAAPILPNTTSYRRAEALTHLASAPDYLLQSLIELACNPECILNVLALELWKKSELPESINEQTPQTIRGLVEDCLRQSKIVSTHYQHVDGTSFAAPVVASVIAQMLEANAKLSPVAVKHILISTADRIPNEEVLRQGYGRMNARLAVEQAQRERHEAEHFVRLLPRVEEGGLLFSYHNDSAKMVAIAGDFNDWNPARTILLRNPSGLWQTKITPPPPGQYRYKYVVNQTEWFEDPSNLMKEPDEYGGLNSVLSIA